MFVLRQGWLYGSLLLPNGSRQILTLHSAGDMVGLSASAFPKATETLVALTDVVVGTFDRNALRALFLAHPRVAAALFAQAQVERVQLADRLAAMGRMTARARVASLLVEMAVRSRMVEPWTGATFTMPLTQEEIGDMIGLTAVHVNRMMRALDREGLIARQGQKITLLDEARLARLGNYVDRQSRIATGWLPPAA
jgi:CRP-like cAMP-binding protein